jgi:spore germination protein D
MDSRKRSVLCVALLSLLSVGCGGGASGMGADVSGAASQDYGATKQMVIDILHSSDGRTALQEILKDPALKQQLFVSETDITKGIEKSLESKKNQNFLTEQAKDPKFAAALSKAAQPELLQLTKQLMKDPEYQKDMLTLLKSPEFTKNIQDLMKAPEFRGQVMKIMTDALQTPSFRMQFQDALKKAVAESMQQHGGGGGGKQGGGGQEGGGSQGGQEQGDQGGGGGQ